ncbi:hypothetical protein FB45DRAFT_901049 [Roridomyces roridus]|uniref:Uncharacterized protein n=1 Tax=Roridomyces roridus TaxID=1738132 RepID=A0AAD7C895_9AGAR|nr:hypothetical protein FB45DRAFT_901049 [Roridomyces roridus]
MSVLQELADLIVDNLEGDTASLKSCCLAARTFVQRSQIHLFQKVEFRPPAPDGSGNNPQKFYQSLILSPHLATLVQNLRIVTIVGHFGEDRAVDDDVQYYRPSWVTETGTLALLIPLLNLKHISIVQDCPGRWMQYTMDWSKIPRTLRLALTTVFASPSLESAEFQGFKISSPQELMLLFSKAASLKSLSISRVHLQSLDEATSWPESQRWEPKLTSLFLSDMWADSFGHLFLDSRIDLSRVSSLRVASRTSPGADGWKTKIIQPIVCPRVQHLAIHIPMPKDIPSIPTTSHLISLHLFVLGIEDALLSLFKSFPVDSRLEKLTLDGMTLPFRTDPGSRNSALESGLFRLSRLGMVEIKVLVRQNTTFSEWSDQARAALQCLEMRCLLQLTQLPDQLELDAGWH